MFRSPTQHSDNPAILFEAIKLKNLMSLTLPRDIIRLLYLVSNEEWRTQTRRVLATLVRAKAIQDRTLIQNQQKIFFLEDCYGFFY